MANIRLILSRYNESDAITKINGNDSLFKLLRFHRLDHPVEPYLIRDTSGKQFVGNVE